MTPAHQAHGGRTVRTALACGAVVAMAVLGVAGPLWLLFQSEPMQTLHGQNRPFVLDSEARYGALRAAVPAGHTVGYVTTRSIRPDHDPEWRNYHLLQYGLAPAIIVPEVRPQLSIVEFPDAPALERWLTDEGYVIVARGGPGLAVVQAADSHRREP